MDLYNLEALMGDTTSTEDYRDLWIVDVDGARGASLLNEASPHGRFARRVRALHWRDGFR